MKALTLFLLIVAATAVFAGKITSLPGYNGPALNMTTGYVTVDSSLGKNNFFWLVEARVNPTTAPLVFWYQGGPGCSGLFGLFMETGPLRMDGKGGVSYTNLTYTEFVNVVYLESPTCVGFSYANQPADCETNDNITATENLAFIKGFLRQFPQYNGRDMWFAGESYGGVYIPTLTYLALQDSSLSPYIKGFTAGNPVMNCDTIKATSFTVSMNTLYWHGLISYRVYIQFVKEGCLQNGGVTAACQNIYNTGVAQIGTIFQQASTFPSLDPDDLYEDFCIGNGTLRATESIFGKCNPIVNQLTYYLNRADVQQAIGAKPAVWASCSNNLNYDTLNYSMVPYYEAIFRLKPSIKVLIYSGDVDVMTVPYTYTQTCIYELSGTPLSNWQPWFVNGVTAGYTESFSTYTYATIRGGGHEVPQYQPLSAYHMFKRFTTMGNLTLEGPVKMHSKEMRPLSQGEILRSNPNIVG